MPAALKYMVDEKGTAPSVIVPVKAWQKLNQDYNKLQKKIQVLTGIRAGLSEVSAAKKTGKKLQSLNAFLRESSN